MATKSNFATALDQLVYRFEYDFTKFVTQRVAAGSAGALNGIRAFGNALVKEGLAPNKRAEVNGRAAAVATSETIAAFHRFVNEDFPNPYREGHRETGKLLAVLSKPGVVAIGDQDGVKFMNQEALDAAAKNWKRLQYGAAPGGGSGLTPKSKGVGAALQVQVRFADRVIRTISANAAPRGGFSLPHGSWVGVNGKAVTGGQPAQFYPRSRAIHGAGRVFHIDIRRQKLAGGFSPTKGIAARRFFDFGLVGLATALNRGYTELYNEAFSNAKTALEKAIASQAGGALGFSPATYYQHA
jgi:hypothetical protein